MCQPWTANYQELQLDGSKLKTQQEFKLEDGTNKNSCEILTKNISNDGTNQNICFNWKTETAKT